MYLMTFCLTFFFLTFSSPVNETLNSGESPENVNQKKKSKEHCSYVSAGSSESLETGIMGIIVALPQDKPQMGPKLISDSETSPAEPGYLTRLQAQT